MILVNYNGSEDTLECVQSVLDADGENINILIVDNNSLHDKSMVDLKSIIKDNIILLELEENLGFGVANNIGAQYAIEHGADYLLLLNNDTVVDAGFFVELCKHADEKTIVVPSIYYFFEKDRLWYAGGKISKWKGTSVHYTTPHQAGYVDFATGCCLLLHKNIIIKHNLFDSKYFMYYEDTDFSIKMILEGIKISYQPTAKVWHKIGNSSQKISGLQEYYINRNRMYLMRKYNAFFVGWFCWTYFIITRLCIILFYTIKFKTIKFIKRAILDFYYNKMGKQVI